LDDGRMTDGHGRTVDFKNAIIIMTSNVGSRWIQELDGSSREEMEDKVTEALRASFKPEFLNRIDEIIIFHNLTEAQIGDIVDIQMKRLESRLAEMNMTLQLSDNARSFLAEKGFDRVYGARPLKRAIQKYIENPLSMEILQGNISEGTTVSADVDGDQIVFTVQLAGREK
jgi:ATP-dependent Clp protease ATP-binding subunit ClpB